MTKLRTANDSKALQEKSTLQWLAPSMARDGLIKNGDWVMPAAEQAASLFADPELHLPAQLMAVLHPFALDYIRQAPALVVAAAHDRKLLHRHDRIVVGRRFIAACETGPKLAQLMQSYDLAPQMRALSGQALRHNHRDILVGLSRMLLPSTLAQAIPTSPDEQTEWLQALAFWRSHMARQFRDSDLLLDWAAVSLRDRRARTHQRDIADFAGRNRTTFNLDWTFAQAEAAAQRWHHELSVRPPLSETSRPDWRSVIDYAPLPVMLEAEGFAFHALQTREALYQEGALMKHCVRTYSDKVARGSSRIYSVRKDGNRVATLELVRIARGSSPNVRFEFSQLKAHRNANPPLAASRATTAFIAAVNPPLPEVDDGPRGTHAGTYARARSLLRLRLGEEVFASWFANMQVGPLEGSTLTVTFPTRFLCNWVEAHYCDVLRDCFAAEIPSLERVMIVLRLPHQPAAPPAAERAPARAPTQRQPIDIASLPGSATDPRNTFASFAIGHSNSRAYVAGTLAARSDIPHGTAVNSLMLVGGSGVGKTHLLQAIAQRRRTAMPGSRVLYLTVSRFRYALLEALRSSAPRVGNLGLRTLDMLLVDDIDLLRDPDAAGDLALVLDTMLDAGRSVVLTSTQSIGQMTWLDARLRARIERGAVCEIGRPDAVLRRAIIERIVTEKRRETADFTIAPDIVERLAALDLGSGRDLAGIVSRLHLGASCLRQPITLDRAMEAARDLLREPEEGQATVMEILRVVARHFAVPHHDILSERRHPSIVWPRQVCMFLAHRTTGRPLPEIGRRLGGREQATVLHAIRRVEARIAQDTRIAAEIISLQEILTTRTRATARAVIAGPTTADRAPSPPP